MQHPCKILVVDDEPLLKSLFLQNFKEKINANEYDFYFVSNGEEALKQLENDLEIGIIILDIKMPKMDGLSLLTHLERQDRFFKIIVITAYGDMSNIRKAMNAGASDVILKPFDIKDLEASLNNIVKRYQFIKKGMEAKDKIIKFNKELEIAKQIKKSFIPIDFTLPFDRFSIYGTLIPSQELGGAFFDFFPLNEHEIAIVIADIADKGISAVLYTAIIQMQSRAIGETCDIPSNCIDEISQCLINEIPFKTIKGLFYGTFNAKNGKFNYCDTGEVISYFISKDKKLTKLDTCKNIILQVFDKIFITTNELLDTKNNHGEIYGVKRLDEILNKYCESPSKKLVQKINEDFKHFLGSEQAKKDIPLFCLEVIK